MSESIGQLLKQAREARRLTLEQASEATHIRPQYLQALEHDDYSVMASPVQGRGFLRIYADFLNLNLDEIVSSVKTAANVTLPSEPAAPEPLATSIPAPDIAPTAAPEAKPAHAGFWSRILRRPVPAAPAEAESQPQPGPEPEPAALTSTPDPVTAAEPPAPASVTVEAAPEPAPEPTKPTRKAAAPKRVKPNAPETDIEKSKAARKTTSSASSKKKH